MRLLSEVRPGITAGPLGWARMMMAVDVLLKSKYEPAYLASDIARRRGTRYRLLDFFFSGNLKALWYD